MIDRNLFSDLESHILSHNYTIDERIWLITDVANIRRHLCLQSSEYLSKYELFCYKMLYGSKSRIVQSTLYLFIIYLSSYTSKVSAPSCLQEVSRFPGSVGLRLPGSFKSSIMMLKSIRYWLPRRSKFVKKRIYRRSFIKVKKDFIASGFHVSFFFLVGSYLRYRLVRSLVHGIDSRVDGLYTIGTVEPLQKYLSAFLMYRGKPVELYVHGIVLDPIGSYQSFSSLNSETQNQGLLGRDESLISLFRNTTPKRKRYNMIEANDTVIEENVFEGVKTLLIFSSSVESGMPVLEVDSLFRLLSKIEEYINPEVSVVIRFHPGENINLMCRVINRRFSFDFKIDDNSNEYFDLAIGLPSTYIRIATSRAKRALVVSEFIYNKAYFKITE